MFALLTSYYPITMPWTYHNEIPLFFRIFAFAFCMFHNTPGGIRTHNYGILSPAPLPIGIQGYDTLTRYISCIYFVRPCALYYLYRNYLEASMSYIYCTTYCRVHQSNSKNDAAIRPLNIVKNPVRSHTILVTLLHSSFGTITRLSFSTSVCTLLDSWITPHISLSYSNSAVLTN